jgi:hypothetical protein
MARIIGSCENGCAEITIFDRISYTAIHLNIIPRGDS